MEDNTMPTELLIEKRQRSSSKNCYSNLSYFFLLAVLSSAAAQESNHFFCGTTWSDASSNCEESQHCPGGTDEECPNGLTCFGGTTCDSAMGHGAIAQYIGIANTPYQDTSNFMFCGSWFVEALENCSVDRHCPSGKNEDCSGGKTCHHTSCNVQDMISDVLEAIREREEEEENISSADSLPLRLDENDPRRSNFCGVTWSHANAKCGQWCLGEDTDCPPGMGCYGDTGCYYDDDLVPTASPVTEPPTTAAPVVPIPSAEASKFCGVGWQEAVDNCSLETHCLTDDDCNTRVGEICYGYLPGCDINDLTRVKAPTVTPTFPPFSRDSPVSNQFCGKSWIHAEKKCSIETHCRSDEDCETGEHCQHYITTCNIFDMMEGTHQEEDSTSSSEMNSNISDRDDPDNKKFCGKDWADAGETCSLATHCAVDDDCESGVFCFWDVPCNAYDMRTNPDYQAVPQTDPAHMPSKAGIRQNYCIEVGNTVEESCNTAATCNPNDQPCPKGSICVVDHLCEEQKTISLSSSSPPSKGPTKTPTKTFTIAPTTAPTKSPTKAPSKKPTKIPTNTPTNIFTSAPTNRNTAYPSHHPTSSPMTEAPAADANDNADLLRPNEPQMLCAPSLKVLEASCDFALSCSDGNLCPLGQFCFSFTCGTKESSPAGEKEYTAEVDNPMNLWCGKTKKDATANCGTRDVAMQCPDAKCGDGLLCFAVKANRCESKSPTSSPTKSPTISPTTLPSSSPTKSPIKPTTSRPSKNPTNKLTTSSLATIAPTTSHVQIWLPWPAAETSESTSTQQMETPQLFCASSVEDLKISCSTAQECSNGPCPNGQFCFPFTCEENPTEFTTVQPTVSPKYPPTLSPIQVEIPVITAKSNETNSIPLMETPQLFCASSIDELELSCSMAQECSNKACPTGQFCFSFTCENNAIENLEEEEESNTHTDDAGDVIESTFYCGSTFEELEMTCGTATECNENIDCPPSQMCFPYDCKQPHEAIEDTSECPTGYIGWYSTDCRSYYECDTSGRHGLTFKCGEGLKFDKVSVSCLDENIVSSTCYVIADIENEGNAEGNNVTSPKCTAGYTGWEAFAGCRKYYWCNNGQASDLNECGDNLLFDRKLQICNLAEEVLCSDAIEIEPNINKEPGNEFSPSLSPSSEEAEFPSQIENEETVSPSLMPSMRNNLIPSWPSADIIKTSPPWSFNVRHNGGERGFSRNTTGTFLLSVIVTFHCLPRII